jgi:PqqD family protein of HPr-rel-A system
MSAHANKIWKVVDVGRLRWRFWDGESVVFHPASGDTHLLNPVAAEALHVLQQGPLDAGALARSVASRLDLEADGELAEKVGRLLDELGQLGLIEPVEP